LNRGVGVVEEAAEGDAGSAANGSANGTPQRLTGDISSREDVVRAIDKICEYSARHEPSSPLPLLLRRAKRLANKSFLDIVRDLSPDALQQVMAWGGDDENDNDN
jgi:type VI secretion system protein ImpA